MSWVIVRAGVPAQAPPMTWEEDTAVERLRQLLHSRGTQNAQQDNDPQRKRSNRMRYFLTAFGAAHWAERVESRRMPLARRGNIAL
jgi:hypothetical protein